MVLPAPTTETSASRIAQGRARGYRPAPLRATRRQMAREPLRLSAAPMLFAAAAFSFGILDARWVWHPPLIPLLSAVLGGTLALVAMRRAPRLLALPLLLLWFAAGQFSASVATVHGPSQAIFKLADGLQRDVTGTVEAVHVARVQVESRPFRRGQTVEWTQQIDLAIDHVEDFNADRDWQTSAAGGLRLTIYAQPGETLPRTFCGERIRVPLRFRVPDRYLDPGAWDYPAYLAQHGIDVLGSVDARKVAFESGRGHISLACLASAAQTWGAQRLARIAQISASSQWLPQAMRFSPDDSGVLSAMLFGDRTNLQRQERSAFERTGSFHLLVVSGLHITIIIGLVFWLARKLRLNPLAATVVALLISLPYAFLTGFAPPVQRALWLSAVYLVSRLLYRERAALNAVGIAAIGILILRPAALFGASFQMTFLAVLAIAGVAAPLIEHTIAPYIRGTRSPRLLTLDPFLPTRVTQLRVSLRMFAMRLRPFVGAAWSWRLPFGISRWALRAVEAVIVAFVVELAMVLPMAVYFHRITLLALPANLLGLPMLAVLLPSALLTFLLGCIHPALAIPVGTLTALLLHAISWLIHLFGNFSVTGLRTPDPYDWAVLFFSGAWLWAIWAVRKSFWWKAATFALLIAASSLVLWPQRPAMHKGVLEVTALDVGQGDSLLIVTPDGHTLLVDAGGPIGGPRSSNSQFDIGEEVVSQYLWSRHIGHLDAVALTHAHSDHMGGMAAVLRNFHPATLWVGHNPPTPEYLALLGVAREEKIPVHRMTAGEHFPFGAAHVRVLAPAANYEPGATASNDDSLVMRIRYSKTAVLLEGDAEAPIEREMVAMDGTEPLTAGLLKVGHHGSSTSTTPAFLAAVDPSYAVISDGRHNPFGHPRVSVLDELAASHVRVYRTDTLGLSTFLLDGAKIRASVR